MTESLEPPRRIRKFNPGTFQSDADVVSQFVVRNRELGAVLDVLRGNVGSPSCQHVLLVAPRGRGKTMLLARVAAELRTDGDLHEKLLPVRFMEESQEIFDVGDFWLETLFYLAREQGVRDSDLSRELRDVHDALEAEWHGRELEERARAAVLETADRLGKQLVLMVENLQTLSRDVDEDFGWKLRGVLQSEPQIIFLATATSRFRELDDAEHPFFELFRIVRLEALDTLECRRLWQMVTGDEVRESVIRPLQILTGGDPRLLVIIGEFAQHQSLRQLMEDLVRLIDDHTEYFRAHLEGFAKTERRVYLALIDLWQPSTTGEIAARARLDVRIVSTLLGRLVERGAVDVEGTGRKRSYVAVQRLYSIYYKLRRERDEAAVVRNLVHFMAVFYTDDELPWMAGRLTLEAAQPPSIREGIKRAIAEAPQIGRIFSLSGLQTIGEASGPTTAMDEGGVRLSLDKVLGEVDETESRSDLEIAGRDPGFRRALSPDTPETDMAVELLHRAAMHASLGEYNSAISKLDQLVALVEGREVPEIQVMVARALVNKGVAQGQLGDARAEMAIYDVVAERFGESDVPELQEEVARALFNKGVAHGRLSDFEAEMATYDAVAERFGDSDEPELQVGVAKALFYKGLTQGQLGDARGAVATYDAVAERFGGSDVPELQVEVARSFVNKAEAEIRIGGAEEALHTCEEFERRSGVSAGIETSTLKRRLMWVRTKALLLLEQRTAAMDLFRSIYAAFVPEEEAMVVEMLRQVPHLIAAGASDRDLVAILSGDSERARMLVPLVVALRQRAGEGVRAPTEVLEVASDIRRVIETKLGSPEDASRGASSESAR